MALTDKDRKRPIILVGPTSVGKTAIIHEFLRRYLTPVGSLPHSVIGKRGKPKKPKKSLRCVWQLDPQRLISGMSFVGQWEELCSPMMMPRA
jgi:GTPase SAR1 family protein